MPHKIGQVALVTCPMIGERQCVSVTPQHVCGSGPPVQWMFGVVGGGVAGVLVGMLRRVVVVVDSRHWAKAVVAGRQVAVWLSNVQHPMEVQVAWSYK
jgi:hypothetical protein